MGRKALQKPQDTPSTSGETMRSFTKKVAFSVAITIAVLACLNGLAALVSPKSSVFWDNPLMIMYPADKFDEQVAAKRFNRNDLPSRSVRYVADEHRWYRLDPEPTIPDTGKLILNFGDSSTFGWGLADRKFAYAGDLNELISGVTSVNLGVPGYSSLQGLRYARELIPRYHDRIAAVTLYFGNNDAVENGSEDAHKLAAETDMAAFLRRHFALFRLMQDAVPRPQSKNQLPRVSPDNFLGNMRQMVALAESYGIPAVVVSPPVNRSWPPGHLTHTYPLAGYVNNAWVAKELGVADHLHAEGVRLAESGNDRADDLFGASVEHDWIVPRIKSDWIVRMDALEQDGTRVVHLDQHFTGAEFPYVFVDYCHPSERTHTQIAERIAALLAVH